MKHFLAKIAAFTAIFGTLFSFSFSLLSPARATVMGVYPGDLIKLKDDKNPATFEDKSRKKTVFFAPKKDCLFSVSLVTVRHV